MKLGEGFISQIEVVSGDIDGFEPRRMPGLIVSISLSGRYDIDTLRDAMNSATRFIITTKRKKKHTGAL